MMILLSLIPAFAWLAYETKWLTVNLMDKPRVLSLFDRTVYKLLSEFDGDLETWDE